FLFIYKKYIEIPPKLDLAVFLFVNLFSITYLSYFFLPFLFGFYNPFSYSSSFVSYSFLVLELVLFLILLSFVRYSPPLLSYLFYSLHFFLVFITHFLIRLLLFLILFLS